LSLDEIEIYYLQREYLILRQKGKYFFQIGIQIWDYFNRIQERLNLDIKFR